MQVPEDAGLQSATTGATGTSTDDFIRIVARVPRVIAILGLAGGLVAGIFKGLGYGAAFLVGAVAAYVNFRLIEWIVNSLLQRVLAKPIKRPRLHGAKVFIQLALFVVGLFVILRFSGFNLTAVLFGFLVCPAAVLFESVYFLFNIYGHS